MVVLQDHQDHVDMAREMALDGWTVDLPAWPEPCMDSAGLPGFKFGCVEYRAMYPQHRCRHRQMFRLQYPLLHVW
jgi:hypothetical protein